MLTKQWMAGKLLIILCCVAASEQEVLGIKKTKDYVANKITGIATDINNAKNNINDKLHDISPNILGPIADAVDPDWLLNMNYTLWLEDMNQALMRGNTEAWVMMVGKTIDVARVTQEIKTSTTSAATCVACKFLVNLGRFMLKAGKSEEDVLKMLTISCVILKIQTERVCAGVMNLIAIDVVQAVKESPMRPAQICSFYLNDACLNGEDDRHEWKVTFPSKEKLTEYPSSPPLENVPVLKVIQISDTHYDPHYLEGANVDCDEPLCCRAVDGQPADKSVTAGKWGDYRKCDTPLILFENALKHIADTHKDVDYILWTGDAPPHDIWNQTREDNLANMKFSAQLLAKYFKDIPIYPSIGNHESCPVDSFGAEGAPPRKNMSWLYDELDREWSRWLPSHTSETIRHGAYYSVLVKPGFRILSVNGNYCSRNNFWLLKNSTDPAGVLAWLIRELDQAETNGEKVHIIGHVPPGGRDCIKVWSRNYYDIINRYEGTIMAQFFGHTHYDEFEVFYDTKNLKRAVNVGYISPSITPWENVNPAYRIYYVEGDHPTTNRTIVDHETWKTNLDEANRNGEPAWYKAYSAKTAYNMTSLHPSEWSNLITRMLNDTDLFETFHRNYYRNSPVRPTCNYECRRRLLCDLRSGRSNDQKNLCYNI
ncbi:sphingomyelin phosphodiesterase-like isoform X2 [Phymastichus coffea]|uniref:sphingomyelin phosphodiesterase-like isoform X2 n=1 Tax=Phymastichus coffea TaxID=108790 RepID=UPI00273A9AA6|nr:sphingomyelin phosphodiesterase-like isoform X2 [Phymastichus coffea]XP_058792160.1 sphingomyelin phosphodiesterase-like isoform X2 [Phymastichus coffea]